MYADELFRQFWWLIFPLFGMGMGLFGMLGHFNQRKDILNLLRTYAEQGKEPPAALLESLQNDGRGRVYRGERGHDNPWAKIVIFGALSAGFAYFGFFGGGGAVFGALSIGFGVAFVCLLVMAIIQAKNPSLNPYQTPPQPKMHDTPDGPEG